jgi:tRNA pseudouridine38-40 synthase
MIDHASTVSETPQSIPTENSFAVLNHRKVPVALLVSYNGGGYLGLQQQPESNRKTKRTGDLIFDTIEGILLEALDPVLETKSALLRACRTDKGVSAVRNVLVTAVKQYVIDKHGGLDGCTRSVNEKLTQLGHGSRIRIVAIIQVHPAFDPRMDCRRRVYHYVIPLFALHPKADSFDSLRALLSTAEPTGAGAPADTEKQIGPMQYQQFAEVNVFPILDELLQSYLGIHRWYNFTEETGPKALKPTDQEAVRNIRRVAVHHRLLFLNGVDAETSSDGKPYVLFQVEGTSFLIHMIRKMVGMAVAIVRGARRSLMDDAFGCQHTLSVPMAPGEGLFLNHLFFDKYDTRDTPKCPSFTKVFESHATEFESRRRAIIEDIVTVQKPATSVASSPSPPTTSASPTYVRPSLDTEMTKFVRLLRVHNWNIRLDRYVKVESATQRKRQEWANRKRRRDETHVGGPSEVVGEAEREVATNGHPEANHPALQPSSEAPPQTSTEDHSSCVVSSSVAPKVARYVDVDDGWIYDHPEDKAKHWTERLAQLDDDNSNLPVHGD